MKLLKFVVVLMVLFLAAFGAIALFGLLAATLKYIFFLGLVLLVGAVGYKALTRKKSEVPLIETDWAEMELQEARRALEGLRRGQLTK